MPLPLSIQAYARGANGTPSSNGLARDLGSKADSYTHSITARYGFESMQVAATVPMSEALDWLQNGLMRSIVVTGPNGQIVWEGYVASVEATLGQEKRALSLDRMTNRFRVRYTENNVPATTSPVSNAGSIAFYGVKEDVITVPNASDVYAQGVGYQKLGQTAYPLAAPNTQVTSGSLGGIGLTITCAGWYTPLSWLIAPASAATATPLLTSNYAQIQSLLSSYVATNAFFSTDYSNFLNFSAVTYNTVPEDISYRQQIETLFSGGSGTGSNIQRLSWGIYENRMWVVKVWAGATPTAITYQRRLGDGQVTNTAGNVVNAWDVRPDSMYQVPDLLDVGPVDSAPDAAARFFVERVVCSIRGDQIGVELEPTESTSLDAQFAALSRFGKK